MTAHKKKIFSRNLDSEQIHLRSEENGDKFIEGYAVLFNQRSKLISDWDGQYYEIIHPQALDAVLHRRDLNVLATIDHNRSKMLGRTKSGTLELIKDQRGLMYRIKVPDTTLGNDIAEMISRGDYYESSFIFTVSKMSYNKTVKPFLRTIIQVENLFDVSVVIDGYYANTAVKLRSQEWETTEIENSETNSLDILEKQLQIHNLN